MTLKTSRFKLWPTLQCRDQGLVFCLLSRLQDGTEKSRRKGKVFDNTRQVIEILISVIIDIHSGVARICCEEGQRWKLCHHGALAADFGAGQVHQLLDDSD